VSCLDYAILSDDCVTLGAITSKDGGSVKGEVERFGETQIWVGEEANLKDCQ
jgi:hypothetical protein